MSKPFDPVSRPRAALLRWSGWFFMAVAALMAVIGLRYLVHAPWPEGTLSALYLVTTYLGLFALFAALPLLLLLPVTLLLPWPRLVRPLAVLVAALMLAALMLDTLVFADNRFHLNTLTVVIMGMKTWAFGLVYVLMFLVLGLFIGRWVWDRLGRMRRRTGPWLAAGLVGCLLVSQGLHIWADARYYTPITGYTPYLPLYDPLTAKRFLEHHDLMAVRKPESEAALAAATQGGSQRLEYPLAPLRCEAAGQPYNLLMLVIDGWRADSMTPAVTPNIARFARRRATVFEDHYSGGNSSRMGMFSLFYGLPATYWSDFYALQSPPVLTRLLKERGYQFGILASKTLSRPTGLDRTAFANVPIVPPPASAPSWSLDRRITEQWRQWLEARDRDRPFFGFLLYNAANTSSYPPEGGPWPEPEARAPMRERRADYLSAVHYLDGVVGGVLADLRERGLMDRTIVMLTSDHGQSFNDEGLGFVGHGSAYTDAQLRVPLIVHWPGRPPDRVARRTAHRDVPATLVPRMLGCVNPGEDFSSGSDLYTGKPWDWFVAGSYSDYAVIEPHRVNLVQPGGYFEIRGDDYRLLHNARPHNQVLEAALRAMGRYYH